MSSALAFFGFKKEITPKRLSLLGSPNGNPNTGPLKIGQGTALAVPENDLIENIGGVLYFTSGGVRTPIGAAPESNNAALEALGSTIKYQTVNVPLSLANLSSPLTDMVFKLTSVYVPEAGVITGIKVLPTVQGDYTGDNNNRIGLYSYDGAGTITLVASSANNANLWKAPPNVIQTIPFSAPYNLVDPGIYFVGMLYSQSFLVTNPSLSAVAVSIGQCTVDFTNNAKLYGQIVGLADLPTPQAFAGINVTTSAIWVALY